jgi:hypothetical protein
MFYLAAILATRKYAVKHGQNIDQTLIKEIVSRTTYDVINTEFIKEYQNTIANVREIIQRFEGSKIIMEFSEFESIIKGVPFAANGGLIYVNDIFQKLDILYDIGFLGLELDSLQRRYSNGARELFAFSDGRKAYASISDEKKRNSRVVIHPIFSEYLLLDTSVDRVVLYYTDQYLRENDLLNVLSL